MHTPALIRRAMAMLSAVAVMLVGLLMAASPVQADTHAPTDLFFSEYVEGSSNNKALEIYNGTGDAVDLAAGGYSVQMYSNGSASAGLTINLTGALAAGDVFVLAQSSANATILAQADQTNGSGWFNGDDAVVLRKGTAHLDVIGQIGFDPGTEWGTGLTSTADNTLRRMTGVCAGDTVGTDAFDPSIEWDGFATDTFDGLGAHTASCSDDPVDVPPTTTCPASLFAPFEQGATAQVSATDDNDGIGAIAITSDAVAGITLESADLATGSATLTVGPTTEPGSYNVTIEFATDAATPQTATCSVAVTVEGPRVITPISEIQGTGDSTPLIGQKVHTTGVVTAAYPTGGFRGVYIQTPGSGGSPKSPGEASDGIFVFSDWAAANAGIGDCVEVEGTATEFPANNPLSLTQLSNAFILPVDDCDPVTATDLETLPVTDAEKEAYEGMLVLPKETYTITNNYALNQYGQIGLAFGEEPLYQATDMVAPGPDAIAYEAANQAKYITLDDGSSWNYLTNTTAKNTPLPYLSAETPMRTASQVTFSEPVILDYRFQWNYQPIGQVVGSDSPYVPIASENDRPKTAPAVGGNLTIGAFNVLNYFDDLGKDEEGCRYYADREGHAVATNFCEVRGAYSQAAFNNQEEKLVAAINKSDADILGLMEIENSAGVSYLPGQPRDKALATLVAALNENAGETRWGYVPSPVVTPPNEDIIRTAYIYNPKTVQTLGASQILLDDAFADARYPLAQKFKAAKTGKPFVMIANHFKSKGSGEDDGSGQGLANPSREEQARALTEWAEDMYEDEAVFLVGDFNAYSKETPIRIIEAAGYTNLAKSAEPMSATYQFSGRLGSLDHMFANVKAQRLVTEAAVWDINGDESIAFQYSRANYNVTQFHAADEFASSDHDPVLVGLDTGPRGKAPARGGR